MSNDDSKDEDLQPLTSEEDSEEFEQAVLKDPDGAEYIRTSDDLEEEN